MSGPATMHPADGRSTRWWLPALAILLALVIVGGAFYWRSRNDAPPADLPPPASTPAANWVTGVFIEPGDGRAPVIDEIEAARRSVDLAVYIVSDEEVLRALEAAAERGVRVRVILEEHPFGGGGGQQATFDRLQRAGVDVRWGNPVFRFSHIKAMVVDEMVAVIMNQNLTASAFTRNREFGVVTNRPDAVRAAAAVFAADWEGGAEPDPGPLVVSPTNARAELLGLIAGAEESVDVYAEVLRDPELLEALAEAAARGVRVRLIVTPGPDNAEERALLAAQGIAVRLVDALYVHAKLIVADGERAFVGSQNISTTSLDQNRELGIIIDDAVNLTRLNRTFEIDFRAGVAEVGP